jgi:hypothetical protein
MPKMDKNEWEALSLNKAPQPLLSVGNDGFPPGAAVHVRRQ